jgi:hypothetical protein
MQNEEAMSQQDTIKAFRAELRARFGEDWQAHKFWLTADELGEPRLSQNGVSLYIWRDLIARSSRPEDDEEASE